MAASKTSEKNQRDGFEIVAFDNDEVVRFIACSYSGTPREKVEMGILRNMNFDKFFLRDTRES